ncbi:oligosaccharide flippase family protein, partial [Candidatus Woesebacteria bacterium]|nr:oligosaccharide flippase family protein [Candidatus Woesebacteria bacterium]
MGYFRDTIKGISWMGALRVVTRALAILKIAITARILSPSQFGLYGIALLVLGFLEVLTETGINVFLIQEKDKIYEYLNSAWVVSIIRGFLIAALIIASSPLVVSFFSSSGASSLLYLVALVAVIRGFINPSEINFQKNLEFNKLFAFNSFLFLVDTAVVIVLAYVSKNEASLILGMAASASFEVILSFLIFKQRPKLVFEIDKIKKVIERGKWITGAGILSYTFQNLDNVVVGKVLGISPLGL